MFAKSFMYLLFYLFLFLAALGLRFCAWAFSSCGEQGLLFFVVCGLLIAVASRGGAQALGARASVVWLMDSVVAHRLCCSAACGIFLDQGSNLHWQADS